MESNRNQPIDPEIIRIFALFFDGTPSSARVIDTSRDDADFRNTVILTTAEGETVVLKIAANGFTVPDRIRMWQRTVEEYRALGYYCPAILHDRNGGFPAVSYHGKTCVVYAEEYAKFPTLEDRARGESGPRPDGDRYFRDIWTMTARIAAKKLDYTAYPSGYCLFETFSPSEETDEVTENALEWKRAADALPDEFSDRCRRIWELWCSNRESLRTLYRKLPTSVFQADLNPTNLLVDGTGVFRGVMDFNLCGKDVFLNVLMRENYGDFEPELEEIRKALRIAAKEYVFSEDEKNAALSIYRCLKPLWFMRAEELKEAGTDRSRIRKCLDRIEYYLTENFDFASCME